jgi:hypothetical protein
MTQPSSTTNGENYALIHNQPNDEPTGSSDQPILPETLKQAKKLLTKFYGSEMIFGINMVILFAVLIWVSIDPDNKINLPKQSYLILGAILISFFIYSGICTIVWTRLDKLQPNSNCWYAIGSFFAFSFVLLRILAVLCLIVIGVILHVKIKNGTSKIRHATIIEILSFLVAGVLAFFTLPNFCRLFKYCQALDQIKQFETVSLGSLSICFDKSDHI